MKMHKQLSNFLFTFLQNCFLRKQFGKVEITLSVSIRGENCEEKPSFQREEQENNSFERRKETKKEKPSVSKKETSRMEKFRTFSAVP